MQSVPRAQVLRLALCALMLSAVVFAQSSSTPPASESTQSAATGQKTAPAPDQKPTAEKLPAPEAEKVRDPKEQENAADEKTREQKNPEADVVPTQSRKKLGPPTTKTLATPQEIVAADALLAPPPAPEGKIALIGGTVKGIDQIRNRMELAIFGGGKMKMFFDERSHFFRDGVETTQLAVKKGDRIYVDSQLDQGKVFARSVRVQSERPVASASGQVIAYDPRTGELTLREPISARPLAFKVVANTAFRRGDQPGSVSDLKNNAIVKVSFLPIPGKRSEIREVELVAVPGTKFTFYGRLTHLDLRSGILAVENKSDSRLYELRFRPNQQTVTDDLVVGAEVNIVAVFTGKDYTAEMVQVTRTVQGQTPND